MSDDNGSDRSVQAEPRSLLGRISDAVEGAARWATARVGEALGSAVETAAGEQPMRMEASPHTVAKPAAGIERQRQSPVERDLGSELGTLSAPTPRMERGRMEQGNAAQPVSVGGPASAELSEDVRRLIAESGISQKSLGMSGHEQGVDVGNDLKAPSQDHSGPGTPDRGRSV